MASIGSHSSRNCFSFRGEEHSSFHSEDCQISPSSSQRRIYASSDSERHRLIASNSLPELPSIIRCQSSQLTPLSARKRTGRTIFCAALAILTYCLVFSLTLCSLWPPTPLLDSVDDEMIQKALETEKWVAQVQAAATSRHYDSLNEELTQSLRNQVDWSSSSSVQGFGRRAAQVSSEGAGVEAFEKAEVETRGTVIVVNRQHARVGSRLARRAHSKGGGGGKTSIRKPLRGSSNSLKEGEGGTGPSHAPAPRERRAGLAVDSTSPEADAAAKRQGQPVPPLIAPTTNSPSPSPVTSTAAVIELPTEGTSSASISDGKVAGASILQGKQKIAFLFLVRGPLPLRPLWELFLEGQQDRASVYVHASIRNFRLNVSRGSVFWNSQVAGTKVAWGSMNMVRATRRLLASALEDPSNQRFVLVSESCIPIRSFDYVHSYLFAANRSFLTSHEVLDNWRYPMPWLFGKGMDQGLVPPEKFRKGSQWFVLTRPHAVAIVKDEMYYTEFARSNTEIPDESYIQTVIPMHYPDEYEPRTVSYVQWPNSTSPHPMHFRKRMVTRALIQNLQVRRVPVPETVGTRGRMSPVKDSCKLAGHEVPCFLFARKFGLDSLPALLNMRDLLGY